jgi:hypothetical protein
MFIDLDHMIIPDAFTIGLAVEGLLLSVLVPALHGQHSGIFAMDSLRSASDAFAVGWWPAPASCSGSPSSRRPCSRRRRWASAT